MTAVHDAILATLNGMVRIFTRGALALPGKSGLAAAAANLTSLIASLPEDCGAPPALPAAPASTIVNQGTPTVPPAPTPGVLDQLTAALHPGGPRHRDRRRLYRNVFPRYVSVTLGERLHSLIRSQKRFVRIAGAGHNDLGAPAVAAAKQFIAQH